MELENLIDRALDSSPLVLAMSVGGVLAVANLVPALAPQSALLALVAVLIWFAAALGLFVLVTWFRDEEWLQAGFMVGLTPVVARLITDLVLRNDLFGPSSPLSGLIVRAIVAVPLCGGAVFGARWLTELIRRPEVTRRPRKRRV